MITGLLFTLAQKPLQPANDVKVEGRHFPPSTKLKARPNLVSMARSISLALAIVGAGLMVAAFTNWSFDPAVGYHIQTAGLTFTLQMGVCS